MAPDVDELLAAARAVQASAYAPYSGFRVGAAIRTASGRVFSGCNVENAGTPRGPCAEAGAISAMVAAGERDIVAVLTVCDGEVIGHAAADAGSDCASSPRGTPPSMPQGPKEYGRPSRWTNCCHIPSVQRT